MQPEQPTAPENTEPQAQELQEPVAPEAPATDNANNAQNTDNADTNEPEQSAEAPEAPEPDAQASEDQPAAEPQAAAVEEEEPEFVPSLPQQPPVEQVDIRQFIDEQGNFDAIAYNQALQTQISEQNNRAVAEATARFQLERAYEKEWDKAYDKFPTLKGNSPESRRAREMVQAIHANSAAPGRKYLSPAKAAAEFFDFATTQKTAGQRAATTSRTVQSAANLGQQTPPAPATSTNNDDLKSKMRHGKTAKERGDAAHELLKQIV